MMFQVLFGVAWRRERPDRAVRGGEGFPGSRSETGRGFEPLGTVDGRVGNGGCTVAYARLGSGIADDACPRGRLDREGDRWRRSNH